MLVGIEGVLKGLGSGVVATDSFPVWMMPMLR